MNIIPIIKFEYNPLSLKPLNIKIVKTMNIIEIIVNVRITVFSVFGNFFLVNWGIKLNPIIITINIIIAVIF
jgi:hypothetical protein